MKINPRGKPSRETDTQTHPSSHGSLGRLPINSSSRPRP